MIETSENPRARSAAASLPRSAASLLAVVGGLCALVAFRRVFDVGSERPPGLEGAEGFVFDPVGSSPPLIFAGTLWLLSRRWERFRRAIGTASAAPAAIALLCFGAATCAWAYYASLPTLVVVALSAWMMGGALWLGGMRALRAIFLPACFVLLAIPLPTALVNAFMYPLQLVTAESAGELMRLTGLDVRYDADLLFHRGAVFQVIESCSGVRTVVTMIMTAFLYHDLFFRSRLQSTLLFLLAPVIALLTNTLRVIVIVLNPYSKFAAVHTAQGLVMIVVAVLLLALTDALLSRWLPADPPVLRARGEGTLSPSRIGALVAATLGLAALTLGITPWQAPARMGEPLSLIPAKLAGYQMQGLPLDREYLGSLGFSEWVHRRYEAESNGQTDEVELLLGADHRIYEYTNFQSDKTALPGPGFQILERGPATIEGVEFERLIVSGRGSQRVVLQRRWGIASTTQEIVRSVLGLDRGPARRPGRALILRIDTEFMGDPRAADERLARFYALLAPSLDKIAVPRG